MPKRSYSAAGSYRYGFKGQENSNEVKGLGNVSSATYWDYDSRLGRRWNTDPRPTTGISVYSAFNNNPLLFNDPNGDTAVLGAGGRDLVEIDEKVNKLEFYKSTEYYMKGTGKSVPVQSGQLRSFSNELGTFSATWKVDANGNVQLVGYENDKGETVAQAIKNYEELTNSWLYKLVAWGDAQARDLAADPVGHNLRITTTFLTLSSMAAVEPMPLIAPNPSTITQEAMSGIGFVRSTAKVLPTVAEGSFSIFSWKGYPISGARPAGPFRILEGIEYTEARKLANRTNAKIHQNAPYLEGLQIHELQPVKFGGSPTDSRNKIYLTPGQHSEYTNFWNELLRNINRIE